MGKWNRNIDPTNPCNGCAEREIGCHGKCERYKVWRADLDEKNERIYKERKGHDTISVAAERRIWRDKRWGRQLPVRRSMKER